MQKKTPLIAAACAALLLTACATTPPGPRAEAKLDARSGSSVEGTVSFASSGDMLRIEARVSGLKPGSEHGFHVHESGDCSAPDASTAKGHFNPGGKPHGHYSSTERHAGDLPNLVADAHGKARYKIEVSGLSLGSGPTGIIGRSVVVHAGPDDYKSQPAGNSGPRIACGTIRAL